MKYDVIIPVAKKDVDFVHWVVDSIRENFVDAESIYIITNSKFIPKLQKVVDKRRCNFIDENKMIEGLSYSNVRDMIIEKKQSPDITGYYFQQFLKMGFALTEYCNDYYLSWDSDTIPLSNIKFFRENHPLFAIKKEHHERYFETMKQVIGIEKQIDGSFIAEHMMFNTSIMRDMLYRIEVNKNGIPWWKVLIACTRDDRKDENIFSEFEMYGSYCMTKYPEMYEFRELKTFRHAGVIRGRWINKRLLRKLGYDLDIATFEVYDSPLNISRYKKAFVKYFQILCNHKLSEWVHITREIITGDSMRNY